ncbi:MAG TPA: heme o synthase [Tepidisphaeraceae bacterium]|jgi:protoheme IX farnesyltransferase|nr:heme o synthase [Tepidisphaeraceae bacterium]
METLSEMQDFSSGGAGLLPASTARARLADYYELTKPRMNFLVVVTTMVGFYMAARGRADWGRILFALIGTALTAAGSSVFNQVVERRLDLKMKRTADRPLPAGRVRPFDAFLFALALSLLGVGILALFVNLLTAALGALTLLLYVLLYTPAKRITSLCTIIGAVPGAIPPVMGFTAVQGAVTPEAMALFAILFFWQMPHFLAIAILYRDDYARGGFLMLPVVDRNMSMTGRQIVLYSVSLIPVSILPALLGMAGPLYFTAALLLGIAFCGFGLICARSKSRSDARRLFLASIIYLPTLLAAMMIDKI